MTKKIITLGATALTTLTLVGVVPTAVFADSSNQNQTISFSSKAQSNNPWIGVKTNSLNLRLEKTDTVIDRNQYLYTENGVLKATANFEDELIVTKNGKRVIQDVNAPRGDRLRFTELGNGDTFTIQPINNAWKNESESKFINSIDSLKTLKEPYKYTFDVNDSGQVKLVAIEAVGERISAQNNSIRLNLKGTGSFLFVENGILCGNNATVGENLILTKNGQTISQGKDNNFTALKQDDTFTIYPINNTTWTDKPVTSRDTLGSAFDSAHGYTFKVNDDGSISFVKPEEPVKSEEPETVPALFGSIDLERVGSEEKLAVFSEGGLIDSSFSNLQNSIIVTKNGKRLQEDKDFLFTQLYRGETFTIQPINNTIWIDKPEDSRESLGTFDSAHRYTLKVNDDGSVSLVKSEKISELRSQESVEQSIVIGGQGIGKDAAHASGFARVTLDVKDHKASLIKGSDYRFHWSGWNSSKYASIKLTDPNGKVMYDQSWKGNESVKGKGYKKFGTFAQYDLPEGSTVEIYHAEGTGECFHTNNDAELKNKLGKAGYTYTYKMQNNQLVLQSVN